MLQPANDNAPPRARRIPLLGTLNVDTGQLRPGLTHLIGLPPGAILGPIPWPAELVSFPSDPREA